MSHTPGPWTIEHEAEDGTPYCDGVRIDSWEGPVAFNVIDCSAHLIAAAPELLAALKKCKQALKNYIDSGYDEDEDQKAYTAAMAALRKAEGRE